MASDASGLATDSDFASDDEAGESTVSQENNPAAAIRGREIATVAVWTLLADLMIFRSLGWSGPAVFFALLPPLFLINRSVSIPKKITAVTIALLWIVSARLLWSGSILTVLSGAAVVIGLAMVTAGHAPMVLEGILLAGRAVLSGGTRLRQYQMPARRPSSGVDSGTIWTWLLPLLAVAVFGAIFVFANPDLLEWVSVELQQTALALRRWMTQFSIWELPFCIVALLVGAGLLQPALKLRRIGDPSSTVAVAAGEVRSPLYAAYRNTLWMLIALFAVYLTFEYMTLWRRDFPEGFYYAGYAHQGAAWLTFALALATAVLSLVFSESMLRDPRLHRIRRLAWIWSAENLILAFAVYNRLSIYVGYNGMTRMRTVGFFGITLVVIGFVLVLYKIRRNRSFWWLIRAQLMALALVVIAYSVFPVDYVAHRYNVARIQSGYLRPAVMIAVKPIADEGIFPLLVLVDCSDETIRDGVRAKLAQRQAELERESAMHWTEFQAGRSLLRQRLKAHQQHWSKFSDQQSRDEAIKEFRQYTMKWY